jgi:hypothetical protein
LTRETILYHPPTPTKAQSFTEEEQEVEKSLYIEREGIPIMLDPRPQPDQYFTEGLESPPSCVFGGVAHMASVDLIMHSSVEHFHCHYDL